MPSNLTIHLVLILSILLVFAPLAYMAYLSFLRRRNAEKKQTAAPAGNAPAVASPGPTLAPGIPPNSQPTIVLDENRFTPGSGEKIGSYMVIGELCSGGMGKIIKAVSKSGKIAAIKIMRPEHSTNEALVSRFQQELRIASMLDHRNIARLLEWGDDGGRHYFVMEFIEGENLRDIIARGAMTVKDVLGITEQVCSALEYAHSKKIVHRDIKPENILVEADGTVKVIDFGIARIEDSQAPSLTVTNVAMGSPVYMSPEQRSDFKHADHRADIYSLGVVLYEMLSGEMPGGLLRLDLVPEGLRQMISKSTAYRPEDRYCGITEMLEDLRKYREAGSITEDQNLIDQIGENARLRNVLIDVLYPKKSPEIPGLDIGFFYIPAGGVGGNYYDFLKIDQERLGVLVGNVFEKPDVKSALFLSMTRSLFRFASEGEHDPAETLRKVNRQISRESENFDRFAVFSYIVYDSLSHILSVATAGYRPVCLLKLANNSIEKLKPGGFGLGIDANSSFELRRIGLGPGDIVVLSSAGIAETMSLKGERYGEERLDQLIVDSRRSKAAVIADRVKDDLAKFGVGMARQDDITLVVLKVEG